MRSLVEYFVNYFLSLTLNDLIPTKTTGENTATFRLFHKLLQDLFNICIQFFWYKMQRIEKITKGGFSIQRFPYDNMTLLDYPPTCDYKHKLWTTPLSSYGKPPILIMLKFRKVTQLRRQSFAFDKGCVLCLAWAYALWLTHGKKAERCNCNLFCKKLWMWNGFHFTKSDHGVLR